MKSNTYVLSFILSFFVIGLTAQTNFFEVVPAKDLRPGVEAVSSVQEKVVVRLDEAAMRNYLANAPLEFQNNGMSLALQIPLPNGKTETFAMVESPLLSDEVAALFPEIKTYSGRGTAHPEALIRLSLTSSGFNAIILNVENDAVYFQAYSLDDKDLYFTYFARHVVTPSSELHRGSCGVGLDDHQHGFELPQGKPQHPANDHKNMTGQNLRAFRIALAATGEFTANYGGSAMTAYNAIVGYANRMNAVYRNELSVRIILVSDTSIVYTNAATDPYTNDNDDALLSENQANIDNLIGDAHYDVSQVLGANPEFTSPSGLADSPAVCQSGFKAQGMTKEADPNLYSSLFNDSVLFHEVGHMFGMSHSYNSNISICTTRNWPTSVEPGSGASIMSYGFTCDDDDYFPSTQIGLLLNYHTVSYAQAVAYLATISCDVSTPTGNTAPTVTMPADVTIPKSTPFALTGSATDTEDQGLTYSWEGTNLGIESPLPDATTLDDPSKPPFFRTYAPKTTSTRIFPVLDSILSGANQARGDKLPSIGIVTTHRMTVRDNNPAGGGVTYGNVTVTVDGNIGPFLVTNDLAGSYEGLSTQTVTWSVNGTDAATANVKISLSTDGGYTFPIVLEASTRNDGTESVMLPDMPTTTTARIKVEAIGNIFFDISNNNFTITPNMTVVCPADQTVCPNADAFALTGGTPGGGNYSGPGVNANVFDPAAAGLGMHTITYTNGNSCTFVITVANDAPGGLNYYQDLDGDGFGNSSSRQRACIKPAGYVLDNTDCDDNDPLEQPGQNWLADIDNDGYSSGATLTQCLRPSGYKVASELLSSAIDCNDNESAIHPGATEICDGIDNNCNNQIDENGLTTYYQDSDGDGFGNPAVSQASCTVPMGYVANNTDCDDNDPLEQPGQTWLADLDNDGYSGGATLTQCVRPSGYKVASELLSSAVDCNDNESAINPGAIEICDGIDNNCNNQTDENENGMATCLQPTITFTGETSIALQASDLVSTSGYCSTPNISFSPTSVDCSQIGTTVDVTVTITSASGSTSCVSQVTVTGDACPGAGDDINCPAGSSSSYDEVNDIWTLTSNCYYSSPFNSDALAFVPQTLCGDGELITQVTSIVNNASGWAGITMRETTDAGAKKVQLTTNRGFFARREVRTVTDGQAVPQQVGAYNRYWLRLTRTGNSFAGYVSNNGTFWYQVMAVNLSMNSCIEVGLVAHTYRNNSSTTATFANYSLTGNTDNLTAGTPHTDDVPKASMSPALAEQFQLFPNPATEQVFLDMRAYTGAAVQLQIFNAFGQDVQQRLIPEAGVHTVALNLRGLQNGTYYLRVATETGDVLKRFVIAP